MSMEIKLTDIRGEPPLKVGEFILDKDNNVMYVGSGNFGLTRNGGAEIGVIAKFIPIPPNKAFVTGIKDISKINIEVVSKFKELDNFSADINNIKDNSQRNISITAKFTPLNLYNITINDIQDNSNISLKGSGQIVT